MSNGITLPATDRAEQAALLFVDDESNILSSLKRLFRPLGYRIHTALGGPKGLEILAREEIDLVISDMRMPGMDGAEFLEEVAKQWPNTVRILLTGYSDLGSTIAAINNGHIYRYVAKPWEEHELTLTIKHALELKLLRDEKARLETLTHAQNEELKELNTSLEVRVAARTEEVRQAMHSLKKAHAELKNHYTTSVKIFANLIELREGSDHNRRVAEQARQLAIAMGLPNEDIQNLLFAALLHDIGKLALPDTLLNRPISKMSHDEQREFEKHPLLGQAALVALEPLDAAAELIRAHHEHVDGTGYPDRLKGADIPLGARILAVVDDYHGLLNGTLLERHYTTQEASDYLLRERNQRYDAKVVNHFIELLANDKPHTTVPSEQCLKSNALKEGMTLSRDLIAPSGVLLLAKGHQLSNELIYKISELEKTVAYDLTFYVATTKTR